MTTRRTVGIVLAAAALTGLTACANDSPARSQAVRSAGSVAAAATTTTTAIHNPVDILRKAGCTIPAGEVLGQPTTFNDGGLGYYADCYWGDPNTGQRMTVWRYPSHTIMLQGNGDGPTRRDGMTFIMSKDDGDWYAEVFAGDNGYASGPTPAMVAARLGGVIS